MFLSGLFSTLGSYAFVRAFEDPHVQSLFTWYHVSSDELLGAWLFLASTLPMVPYACLYIWDEPNHLIYWVTLLLAIAMVAASGFFVKLSYPVDEKESMVRFLIMPLLLVHFSTIYFWVCVSACLIKLST